MSKNGALSLSENIGCSFVLSVVLLDVCVCVSFTWIRRQNIKAGPTRDRGCIVCVRVSTVYDEEREGGKKRIMKKKETKNNKFWREFSLFYGKKRRKFSLFSPIGGARTQHTINSPRSGNYRKPPKGESDILFHSHVDNASFRVPAASPLYKELAGPAGPVYSRR